MTVVLSCQPAKNGSTLVFPYTVENRGSTDVYVMDALPSVDAATRKPRSNDQATMVVLGADAYAAVGKFIPPLPTDRRIAVPTTPLARRLRPDASFDNCITVPLPLAEASPYFADLLLRQYEMVDIKGVAFTIGYWVAGSNDVAVMAVEYAPELYSVIPTSTTVKPGLASQRFPTTKLQLFKRSDAFPRDIGQATTSSVIDADILASGIRPSAA
jgi:hypothetical protein